MSATTDSYRERFFTWLERRTAAVSGARGCQRLTTPGRPWLTSFWPSLILFVFVLQAVTGWVLWTHYSPSTQTAWESIYYLQYEVPLGWLLRGVHHYAGQVMVALLGLYVIQLVVWGEYRRPREFVFWAAVVLGMVSLGLILTGDLLAWDQSRLSATQTRVSFLMLLPQVGGELYKLVLGGPTFGHLTLTRFFALHVGVLAPAFLVLLLLHRWFLRRAAQPQAGEQDSDDQTGDGGGRAYWPDQFLRNAAGCAAVMALILLLVFQHSLTGRADGEQPGDKWGVVLGAPADTDPASAYAAARPEWAFRGLHALSLKFSGAWQIVPIFILPHLALALVLAMPLIAYFRGGHRFNVAVLVVLVAGVVGLSYRSYREDAHDPEFQAAVAEGRQVARRATELARDGQIPPTGALSLLRSDPLLQGPELFSQHCGVCHSYTGPGGEDLATGAPNAPNLYRFASRDWIDGLLDPERVAGPEYFGNTRFAAGIMVQYVSGRFEQVAEDDRQAIIAALSAEAQLPVPAESEAADAARIADGHQEIVAAECTRCHAFHDEGVPGDAPVLTGYGSRAWLIGVISNPEHPWFYGNRNDDMPAFLTDPGQPADNRLMTRELAALVGWLRGPGQGPDAPLAATEGKPPLLLELGKWQARLPAPVAPPEPDDLRGRALAIMQRAQCNLCHDYRDEQGQGLASREPVAPSLWDFASAAWLQGLMDPDQIDGPAYFGNNPNFRSGMMVSYVKDSLYEFYVPQVGGKGLETLLEETGEPEVRIDRLSELLAESPAAIDGEAFRQQAAEAAEEERFDDFLDDYRDPLIESLGRKELDRLIDGLAGQREWDTPQEIDEATLDRFRAFGCADCHYFHGAGYLGIAPDMTGYGSRDWLTGIITNPEDERFYPNRNDGMPAYHAFPEEPAKNLLTREEIETLADLIRGRFD